MLIGGRVYSAQTGDGPLEHYERLGYVVATRMILSVVLMWRVNAIVQGDAAKSAGVPVEAGGRLVAHAQRGPFFAFGRHAGYKLCGSKASARWSHVSRDRPLRSAAR